VRFALVESIWSGRFGTSVSRDPSHLLLNRDLIEPDVTIAAQPLLNGALNEDTLDDGWVRTATAVIFLVSLTAENRFWPSRSTANRATSAKHPLENVQRSIRVKLHCEISLRQKLQESILRRSRWTTLTGIQRHSWRENLNLGDRLGEMASYLSQVSCLVYRSGRANEWKSLAPTISEMSCEVLCEII
jgi:hypothetical protein